MSNIYDSQFRARALHRRLFCDSLSADIITECVKFLDIMDGALHLAAELHGPLKDLIPSPDSLTPGQHEKWQKVIDVIFKSADYADRHKLHDYKKPNQTVC